MLANILYHIFWNSALLYLVSQFADVVYDLGLSKMTNHYDVNEYSTAMKEAILENQNLGQMVVSDWSVETIVISDWSFGNNGRYWLASRYNIDQCSVVKAMLIGNWSIWNAVISDWSVAIQSAEPSLKNLFVTRHFLEITNNGVYKDISYDETFLS